ncbi:MAG: hypothetical protein BGP04_04685 [Rhizobiales bacterium 62-17]|nr:DUF4336 domain-containing protein [Hyphomicrobiales bacterium]OJY02821.1 MAG: hypothetical protein BGP04_04685 [Rhizobiales bacterium 62-17]
MLNEFGPNIWIADGTDVVAAMGFRYPTRMAVIRLANGDLFIWSPTALTATLCAAVDRLGPVRHLVAPNSLHHVFLPDWKLAYPEALVYAAPGLRQKRKDIVFDRDLSETPEASWAGEIDQAVMNGNAITTEVVFFHLPSGTVLFTDLLQRFPADWFTGWRGIVAKLDLMVAPEPTVPRKFRVAFTQRKAARPALSRVLSWPAEKVVMAHGTPVIADGQAFLRRAFAWLSG